MKTLPTLTDFLKLNIDSATDAYLRELALVAIQSHHLAHTVEQLSAYQQSLELTNLAQRHLLSPAEAEAPKGKLIEGRYLVANNGTVTDQQSRLIWMRSALEGTFTFEGVQQAAKNLNAQKRCAGHAGWRVPSKKELFSLVKEGSSPTICEEAFPDTPEGYFWTSTPHANDASDAWVVYFSNGCTFGLNRSYYGHVRLVR